ncbi:MAG: hypothetical protein RL292_378 [Candidatus Parcubacteria bacterium]|jgi:hypothetical protein
MLILSHFFREAVPFETDVQVIFVPKKKNPAP